MTVLQALVLGVIQGLSEFLPISSSAHLLLAPWLFGWPDPGLAFDVALHVGTLVAVLWFFGREWVRLFAAGVGVLRRRTATTAEERRAVFLVLATIPGALAGLAFNKLAEREFRSPALVAGALIVVGLALWLVDRAAARDRGLDDMTWRDALLVGAAQMFAIVPGVSRSGSTITAGRAMRLDRESAAVFSFLMSMPIIAAAAVLEVPKALRETGVNAPVVVGVLASAVSGWAAIAIVLRYVTRHGFGIFALYRVALGLLVLGLVLARA